MIIENEAAIILAESLALRPEYDFAAMQGGVSGKYVQRYRSGTNLVLLDPDIAKAFPTDTSVKEALRLLVQGQLDSKYNVMDTCNS